MQTSSADSVTRPVEQPFIGHFTCSFASTFSYRKPRYSVDAITRLAQGIEGFAQPEPQGADHARSYHRDPSSEPFPIRAGGFGHLSRKN
ncbi:MAG: hypothetical protein DMF37_10315 [Verrucomicrobia bacterium]|nr:MAG: hypothetical protein DMF37_10315 [Verrucomicrobiota bacterium]